MKFSPFGQSQGRLRKTFNYRGKRSLLLSFGIAVVLLVLQVKESLAQPNQKVAAPNPATTRLRLDFIDKTFRSEVKISPSTAVDLVPAFIAANPNMDQGNRIELYRNAAETLYMNVPLATRSQYLEPALKLISDAEALNIASLLYYETDYENNIRKLKRMRVLLLLREKRWEEAQSHLDSTWEIALRGRETMQEWASFAISLLRQQQREAEILPLLHKTWHHRLIHQGTPDTHLGGFIAKTLIDVNEEAEALAWGKLAFQLSAYEQNEVQQATDTLASLWAIHDANTINAQDFVKAQENPKHTNPLDKIPSPKLDVTAIRAMLEDKLLKPSERISVLLILGDYHEAMFQARDMLYENPYSAVSLKEVARVFKAKDGDIARANQFVASYQNGQGDNLLKAFLQETKPVL
jgi:hypothetical protein